MFKVKNGVFLTLRRMVLSSRRDGVKKQEGCHNDARGMGWAEEARGMGEEERRMGLWSKGNGCREKEEWIEGQEGWVEVASGMG